MEEAGEKPAEPGLTRRDARPDDAALIISWFPARQDAVWWGAPSVVDPLTADWLAHQFTLALIGSGLIRLASSKRWPGSRRRKARRVAQSFRHRPPFARRGLGVRLMQEIIEIARQRGDTEISLGVYGSNHIARRVFDRLGFRMVGERAAKEDASGISVIMRLEL